MPQIKIPKEGYPFDKLIKKALSINKEMTEYSSYPPILNSSLMLLRIQEIIDKKDELSTTRTQYKQTTTFFVCEKV